MARRRSVIVSLLVVGAGFSYVLSVLPQNAGATTLFVGGSGPGNYTTIQSAIDDANPGDTVFVFNGTYPEVVHINAPISLVGEDKDTTIIGGNYDSSGIWIHSDWVNVTGITFTENDDWIDAISLMQVENCTIHNNTISHFLAGIGLSESHNNSITNNTITSSNGTGMSLFRSNDNLISGNNISMSYYYGIGLIRSSRNTFTNNTMVENSFYVYSGDLEHWTTHTIDTSNTVNGKPVQYWKNATGGTVPSGAGQVILGNCTGVVVENQYVANTTVGMVLGLSSGNFIKNNTVLSSRLWGIHLAYSGENLVVNNTVAYNGDGFELDDSNNNTFIGNNVSFNNWDGFYLEISHNNTFTGNSVSFNKYTGIVIWNSINGRFSSNSIVENGIVMSGDSLEHWNTHVIDTSNTVNGKPVHYWKNTTGGIVPPGAGQVILANCTSTVVENQNVAKGDTGIAVGFSSDIVVANNTADFNTGKGIDLHHTSHSRITQNNASSIIGYGIMLSHSENNSLDNNRISSNSYGMYLYDSHGNDISDNFISGSTYDGIRFGTSNQNNTISGNYVSGNHENGIHFYSSGNAGNAISNNTIRSNRLNGILLNHTKSNIVVDNILMYNDEHGILIWYSHENVLARNGFDDNELSIALHFSSENSLYHNRIPQAFDDGLNFWNSSYPSGGNFWINYGAGDVYSGPNQDQLGSDGIGDLPHDVPGGFNKDWYPLIEPDVPSSPTEPRNLEAVPGNGKITLTWDVPWMDGGRQITNYAIYRGTSSSAATFLVELGNVLTYTDTGLTNGLTYYYQVSAANIFGEGPRSSEVNATPVNEPPICTITDPSNGTIASGRILINGTSSDPDGVIEKVEMKVDDGPWIEIEGTIGWSQQWYTTTVSNGNHTVYFKSYDGEDYSDVVNVTLIVDNPVPPPTTGPEDALWLAVATAFVALLILLLIVYLLYRRRKKGLDMGEISQPEEPPPD
jgi:LPXTG-motif cell wall-anchored protein